MKDTPLAKLNYMEKEQIAILKDAIERTKTLQGHDEVVFVNFAYMYLERAIEGIKASFEIERRKLLAHPPRELKSNLENSPRLTTSNPDLAEKLRKEFPNTEVILV